MLRQASILAASLALPDPFLVPYTKGSAADGAKVSAVAALGDGGGGGDDVAKAAVLAAAEAEDEAKAAAEDVSYFKPRLRHHLAADRSEVLTTLSLFEEWQRVLNNHGAPRAAQYAHSQHASYKRLAEIEHLSRELMQRLRQQRVEFQMPLPNAGQCLVGPASTAAPVGEEIPEAGDNCAEGEHTVVAGDFPLVLVRKYDVTLEALEAANADNPAYGQFIVGQTIIIPAKDDC